HQSNPMHPILTVETDASTKIIRQDYGPGNTKIDEKFHQMINEWNEENPSTINLLSINIYDLYDLLNSGAKLPEEQILSVINSDNIHKKIQIAKYYKHLNENAATLLMQDDNVGIKVAL